MSHGLQAIRQSIMFLNLGIEFLKRVVDIALPERSVFVGFGKGRGGAEGLRERLDLGAEEGGFEVDYCGRVGGHVCGCGGW